MICHIVAVPKEEDLKLLNNLRSYIYQNNFRFKNKPLDSDTHMTLAEVDIDINAISKLEATLSTTDIDIPFKITNVEWVLAKEDKEPNYKYPNPYTWIALKFPQRGTLYHQIDELTKAMGINNNDVYIENVKRIEKTNGEYIGNHMNLSNYTRREKAEGCWQYFKDNLPQSITFDTLGLRDSDGRHIFEIHYE